MPLEYDVNEYGNIIKIKHLKDDECYEVKREKVDSFPTKGSANRLTGLKRAICTQDLNVIVKYSGFETREELKRVTCILSPTHQKREGFMKSMLKGTILEFERDYDNLCFYVKRIKENDNH